MMYKTNLCATCLSNDRRLIPINKMGSFIPELNFCEMIITTGQICWECEGIIRKFHKFRSQVQTAQGILNDSGTIGCVDTMSKLSIVQNIVYINEISLCTDPLTNDIIYTKDFVSIKEESDHSDNYIYNTTNNADENSDRFEDIQRRVAPKKRLKRTRPITNTDLKEDFVSINKESETISDHIDNSNNDKEINGLKDVDNETVKERTTSKRDVIKRKSAMKTGKTEEEKFVEVLLTEEEVVKNREVKRNQPNFKKIPYKCDSCVLGFTRKELLNLHMMKKHDENVGVNSCDVCLSRFPNSLSAERHRRKHFLLYKCLLCRHESSELWAAVNHCRSKHSADRPDSIHCTQCEDVFKTPKDLEVHTQSTHAIICDECGDAFKAANTLRRHKARIHSLKREYTCNICTKTFSRKTRLETHITSHNSTIAKKLAFCEICNIQYKNIYAYRGHLRNSTNHSERSYACPKCDKRFASKVYWNRHYQFYHLKKSKFRCDTCNKLFISDWFLRDHRQKYHGLSRPRNHTCTVCGKKFFNLSILRRHQLIHSEQRSFMCEDCGDTFKQRPALYTHARLVHSAKRPNVKKKND